VFGLISTKHANGVWKLNFSKNLKEIKGKSLRAFNRVERLVCWLVRMECSRLAVGEEGEGV